MSEEQTYTLDEARKIILPEKCRQRGYHDLEQTVIGFDSRNQRIVVTCNDCQMQFKEEE